MSEAIVRIWKSRREAFPKGYTAELRTRKQDKYAIRYIGIPDDDSLKDFFYVLFQEYDKLSVVRDERARLR